VQTGAWSKDGHTPDCDPAEAAEVAAVEPAAAPIALISISDKRNVMFEFDSDVLTPAAIQEMDAVVGRIGDLEDVSAIRIVGHTDSVGPEAYNQGLSERRAESVKRFLESRGINANLLSASGEGELNPVADNASAQGRAMNRRVDIAVSGKAAE
jgi:outer membrane protein OmpA-like peptidoglycan-associated protein